MNEHLLQYIWLHRFFNMRALQTEDHQPVILIHQGIHNKNQGPDFLHARMRIGGIELAGSVEIHVKTSHWYQHAHSGDIHYNNVILHVVWEHDMPFEKDIQVLSLKGIVPKHIILHYETLMTRNQSIPCENQIKAVKPLIIEMWKERMFAERLTVKTAQLITLLKQNKQNEEEGFWQMIFRAMGTPVNSDAFESIFRSVSLKIWLQSADRIQVVEALLLGQAGLLNDHFDDDYLMMLKKEFGYLKKKYVLQDVHLLLSNLRMRPAHFPMIRLVQLAMILHQHPDLLTQMSGCTTVTQMKKILMVTANDFWHRHYALKEKSVYKEKQVGDEMASRILANAVLPFLYLQAEKKRNIPEQLRVMEFFTQLKPERNHITKRWVQMGIRSDHAFDAQSLLHLHKNYCLEKRCLDCAIGREILKC